VNAEVFEGTTPCLGMQCIAVHQGSINIAQQELRHIPVMKI
jgi:hypothetical protein